MSLFALRSVSFPRQQRRHKRRARQARSTSLVLPEQATTRGCEHTVLRDLDQPADGTGVAPFTGSTRSQQRLGVSEEVGSQIRV